MFFTKKPFKERIKDTGFLLKNSFTIVGKDKDIKTPTLRMVYLMIIIRTLFFMSIVLLFIPATGLAGFVLLFIVLFILVPFRFFYDVRQKADQSWLVYNTLKGVDISYSDAHKHTAQDKGKLRIIALVDLVVAYISKMGRNRKGIIGIIINLLLKALEEAWDLLSHYLLPATVIEQKSFKETIPTIKSVKDNVPATLTGVFGIDFVGNIVGLILAPIYFVFILLGILFGYLVGLATEVTTFEMNGFMISWVPIVVVLYIISIAGGIVMKLVASVKTIYFTIFYTSIMRPMDIQESMRSEMTHFLKMEKVKKGESAQISPQKDTMSPRQKQLDEYVRRYTDQGYPEGKLRTFLTQQGYQKYELDKAFNHLK